MCTVYVTELVPHFEQSDAAYVGFPGIHDAYEKFDLEMSFKPETTDGQTLVQSVWYSRPSYIVEHDFCIVPLESADEMLFSFHVCVEILVQIRHGVLETWILVSRLCFESLGLGLDA